MMTLLDEVITRVRNLPASEQEAFAAWMLAELEDEERWASAFAESQDLLAELADEALAEYEAGKTRSLDLDEL
jgi:hypothetical protein